MWYGARSPCRRRVSPAVASYSCCSSPSPLACSRDRPRPASGPFAGIVDSAARRHGVDPDLVHAVIAVESGYRATAQSPAGAQGLMQLMPGTQRDLGVSDAFDPPGRMSTPASPTCDVSPTSSGPCSRWPPTTPGPAPCGATTASRHTRRRAPTCRPFSTAAVQLPMHRRPRNRTPPETERSPRPRRTLLKAT